MRLRDLGVGQRLALGFGVVLLLLAAMVGVYLYGQQRTDEATRQLTDVIMPRADAAHDVETAYDAQSAAARGYVYSGDERYLAEYRNATTLVQDALGRLEGLPKAMEGAELLAQIQPLVAQHTQFADRAIALRQQGSLAEAQQVVEGEMASTHDQLAQKAEALVALQFRRRDEAKAEIAQVRADTTRDAAVLALLALASGSIVALLTTRSVSRPARTLAQASRALATGDFGEAVDLASRVGGKAPGATRDEMRQLAGAFGLTAQALLQRDKRLSARASLVSALASSIEAERLTHDALQEIAAYTGSEFGLAYAYDQETGTLSRVGSYCLDGSPDTFRIGEGIPGEAAAARRQTLVRDIPTDTPFQVRFGFDQVPPRTVVATPMLCQDQLVGVVLLGSLRELSGDALDFLEVSAQQLGVSLQNALAHRQVRALADTLQEKNELLVAQNEELQAQAEEIRAQNEELQVQNEEVQAQSEELQAQNEEIQAQSEQLAEQNRQLTRQAEQIARLQAITARLSESLSPQEVLEQVVRAASDLLGSDVASVLLLDESRTFLKPAASVGLDESQQANLRIYRWESLAGRVIAEGRTLFLEDVSQATEVPLPVLAKGQSVGSLIVAPLLADGQPLGVVEVYFTTPRGFSTDEAGLLSALAAAAAVAVRNARQFDQLKEIDRQKDEFLSQASHELKSPLTSLKGFAQLLQRQINSSPGHEAYQKSLVTIDRQVDKVVRLVDRLLDVSRAQMGRLEMRPERTDLSDLVRQQAQQTQVKTDKHRVIADVDDGVVGEWDRGYLEQVLANLLENAVRYSPDGGQIRVSLRRGDGVARLAVADQGIGIPQETLPNLFKRYYRSDEAKRVSADGMGIGLYVTQEIVAAHGGRIWAESEPGKGSTFTVELPLYGLRGGRACGIMSRSN